MNKYSFLSLLVVTVLGSVGSERITNQPRLESAYATNLTFSLSADNLPNTGVVSNVDPYIKVYESSSTVIEPVKIGTTEVVDDNASPEFITVVSVQWNKGKQQKLTFKVKDNNKLRDETLGEATLDVDTYVINKGQRANLSLSNGGSLLVQKTTPTRFRLYARNLPNKDPFNGKSDAFVKCYWRRGSAGKEIKFHTTKTIDNNANPDWNETIEFPNYIKGNDMWLLFKVRDYDGVGSDDDLGEALLEIDPYVTARQTKPLRLGKAGESRLYITPV